MAIDVHTTGLEGFQSALREYELASSKTREEVLEHRARNFAFALHREGQRVGRNAKRKIERMSASKMKVFGSSKRSKRQEKARRIYASGYVAAGFLPALRRLHGRRGTRIRSLADVKSPEGSVRVDLRNLTVDIINAQRGAYEADQKHGISDKAYRNQERDMARYLQRKADRDLERAWR